MSTGRSGSVFCRTLLSRYGGAPATPACRTACQGAVAVVTLDRPQARNAIDEASVDGLERHLDAIDADDEVRVTVLTGAGDQAFCAGGDLKQRDGMTTEQWQQQHAVFEQKTEAMRDCPVPIIAAVNGAAAGLGMSYALLADLRFVEKTAKFTTAFSARGLVAEHGMSWILPRLLGPAKALDILWTARRIAGEEAVAMGLGDRLCETGESVNDAKEYIRQLAATAAPLSLMIMKQQVYKHVDMPIGPAMDETERLMDESLVRPDFREGVRSFMEKRPPNFERVKVG